MSILRVTKRDNPFVQIEKAAIEDTRLSWRAKGLLVYFLSKPDNWTIRMAHIVRQSTEGRDALRTAMNELKEAGYASLKNTSSGSEWNIREQPRTKPCPENPHEPPPEKPSPGFANLAKSAPSNNEVARDNKKRENNGASADGALIDRWREFPQLPAVRVISAGRKRAISARMRDPFFRDNFSEAIERIAKSDFCTGVNDRGWRADFDFLLRPETIVKVMEGKYDNRRSAVKRGGEYNLRENEEPEIGLPEVENA